MSFVATSSLLTVVESRLSVISSRIRVWWPNPWKARDSLRASFRAVLVRSRKPRAPGAAVDSKSVLFEELHAEQRGCGSHFVLREDSIYRRLWNVVVAVLLVYTATIFPYRLAFVDFKIRRGTTSSSNSDGWDTLENIVDAFWYGDLVLNFFLSYRDQEQHEVTSVPRIAKRYLCKHFILNLAACMPQDVQDYVAKLFGKATAVRVSPLLRMVRIARLAKLASLVTDNSFKKWVQNMRAVRAVTFLAGLMEVVHITACGLYLVAALSHNPETSWVGLRKVFGDAGDRVSLIEADSFEQWLHSLYLTLTVFTTVGLDAFAVSTGECLYTSAMMVVGALVQSIVVSKIMNLVTDADQENHEILQKRELVLRWAQHAQLDPELGEDLGRWVTKSKSVLEGYDQDEMRNVVMYLLTDSIMEKLHKVVFRGRLVKNRLITVCTRSTQRLPPRFPLLLALGMHMQKFESGQMVYYWSDHPWNVFLVMDGAFAYVARPHPAGGICEVPCGPRHRMSTVPASYVEEDFMGSLNSIKVHDPSGLFPYLLFGHGSYFGEFEMFVQKSRVSSVRCEVDGAVLIISKVDFLRLADEFPDFAEVWKSRALRREGHRKASLKKLKEGLAWPDLAACAIQRTFRARAPPSSPARRSMTECLENLEGLLQVKRSFLRSPSRSRRSSKEVVDPMEVSKNSSRTSSPQRSRRASREDIIGLDQVSDVYTDVEALRWEIRSGQAQLMKILDETLQAVQRRRMDLMQRKVSVESSMRVPPPGGNVFLLGRSNTVEL